MTFFNKPGYSKSFPNAGVIIAVGQGSTIFDICPAITDGQVLDTLVAWNNDSTFRQLELYLGLTAGDMRIYVNIQLNVGYTNILQSISHLPYDMANNRYLRIPAAAKLRGRLTANTSSGTIQITPTGVGM